MSSLLGGKIEQPRKFHLGQGYSLRANVFCCCCLELSTLPTGRVCVRECTLCCPLHGFGSIFIYYWIQFSIVFLKPLSHFYLFIVFCWHFGPSFMLVLSFQKTISNFDDVWVAKPKSFTYVPKTIPDQFSSKGASWLGVIIFCFVREIQTERGSVERTNKAPHWTGQWLVVLVIFRRMK